MKELLMKLKEQRSGVLEDVAKWLEEGYDYKDVDEAYDEGYVNALNYAIKLIEGMVKS